MLERMLENSALAGVMSSVVMLSTVFKLTGTHRCSVRLLRDRKELDVRSFTTSTCFASSSGAA